MERVPMEIWRDIFRLVLGPSLSNPERDGYDAFKRLFSLQEKIFRSYKAAERLRSVMSLVCQYWKSILADMDDGVVVQGPDGLLWPPHRRIEDAKLAVRVDRSSWADMIRLGSVARLSAPQRILPPFDLSRTKAKGVKAVGDTLNFTNSDARDATIELLGWQNLNPTNDLQALWHPTFRNLIALQIRTVYPFDASSPASPLHLPRLRCLFLSLHAKHYSAVRHDIVSKWSFPCLQTFRIATLGMIPHLAEELSTFLRVHAQTVQDVVIGGSIWGSFDISPIWSSLTRLRLYQFEDLETLLQSLALLRETVRTERHSQHAFRVLLFHTTVSREATGTITRDLRAEISTLARLEIQLALTWPSSNDAHNTLLFFLDILGEVGLVVMDADGVSSEQIRVNMRRER